MNTEDMMKKVCHADGFIAALDQSGGSSKLIKLCALQNYKCQQPLKAIFIDQTS